MSAPTVAVIIPAYNVENYIRRAVESASNQTVPPYEIIVIDDASTDATAERVRALGNPTIRVFTNSINRGPSASRNIGFGVATSDWVALLDADDWWDPRRLEVLLGIARGHNADIVADNFWLIEDGVDSPWGTAMPNHRARLESITLASLGKFDYGIFQPVFNRHFLERFRLRYDESLRHAEDFIFLFECLSRRAKMVITSLPLSYYRHRTNSLATRRMEAYPQGIDALKALQSCAAKEARDVLGVRIRELERGYTYTQLRRLYETRRRGEMIRIVIRRPVHAGWVLCKLPWMLIRRARKRAVRRTVMQGRGQ